MARNIYERKNLWSSTDREDTYKGGPCAVSVRVAELKRLPASTNIFYSRWRPEATPIKSGWYACPL